MHPLDVRKVGQTFRRLAKSGIEYNPELVKEWLKNDGWMDAWVNKVSDIAYYEQIMGNTQDFLEDAIDNWRREGSKADIE